MRISTIALIIGTLMIVTAGAFLLQREMVTPGPVSAPSPVASAGLQTPTPTNPTTSAPRKLEDAPATHTSSAPRATTTAIVPAAEAVPVVVAPKPVVPILPPAPTTSTAPSAPARTITAHSIVGVLCYYRYNGGMYPSKGSGTIVSPQGIVLTARHLVDPQWTFWAYATTMTAAQKDFYAKAQLDHCEIGLPEGNTLPTAQEIRSINPGFTITQVFQYSAVPVFIPRNLQGESDNESRALDFALLRITGPTTDCATRVQRCDLVPSAFPYTPLLHQEMPRARADEVLTFGYPAENINDGALGFFNFFLKGAVGQIQDIFIGDAALKDAILSFSFTANDLQSGRSGSALFYKGYVIGVLYGNTSTQTSFNVSAQAIHTVLLLNNQAELISYQ